MVMPRSRSRSIESSTCAVISRWLSAPVSSSRRSASVDLPWSMCAMMQKLRMKRGSMGSRAGRGSGRPQLKAGEYGPRPANNRVCHSSRRAAHLVLGCSFSRMKAATLSCSIFQRSGVRIHHVPGFIKLEFDIFLQVRAESAGDAFRRCLRRRAWRDRNSRRSTGL